MCERCHSGMLMSNLVQLTLISDWFLAKMAV